MSINEKGLGSTNVNHNLANTKSTTTSQPLITPPPPKKDSMKAYIPISIVLGLLMLGFIGYQAYANSMANRALEEKIALLEEADELRLELEDEYSDALAELEEMRGLNEELNLLIDEQQDAIEEERKKVSKMIRQKRNLANARNELTQFKVRNDELVAQVETLQAENEALAEQNAALVNDNSLLKEDLDGKIEENGQLNEAKAMLVSEKAVLTKKVNIASVISVKNVKVEGYKMRGDKPVKKKSAKTIDQLKVCFTTIINEVTEPGKEKFYIRIVNPKGGTMAVEELGSGVIMNKKTGEEVPFTQVKEYNYANDEAELCFVWEPNLTFQRGAYEVEVYNKGHKAGKGMFVLK